MIELGEIHIYPFEVHHDAIEPLGYAIEDDVGDRSDLGLTQTPRGSETVWSF